MLRLADVSQYWYCPREFLNYVLGERKFGEENLHFTAGDILHQKIHAEGVRTKKGIRQIKNFPIASEKMNISGKTDLLEIKGGAIYPVEYKKGAKRLSPQIVIQVKLQMLILSDMLGREIPYGYLSFSCPHERVRVNMGSREATELRQRVEEITTLLKSENPFLNFPRAADSRCECCSFRRICF